MLESVVQFQDTGVRGNGSRYDTYFTLSPGVRGGWNVGDKQIVIGAAVPVTWNAGESNTALLVYFSYELPFKK
jgi:hypothetical protein